MIHFRPIRLEDKKWIEHCRNTDDHPFSALSFPSLFMWQREYGLTIAGDDDFFVIRSCADNGYYAPCGNEEKCKEFLWKALRKEGKQKVLYVTRQYAEMAKKDGYRASMAPGLSEYICSTKALALKEGRISPTYRKKFAKFSAAFPYHVKKIEKEDLPELLSIIKDWQNAFAQEQPLDLDAALLSLENYEALDLTGILLHTEQGLAAFSFGFQSAPDTYTMSVVKYDLRLPPEVTMVCTCEEAKATAEPYEYCNLEEDLDLAGLRSAKLQCSPVKMHEVYIIEK